MSVDIGALGVWSGELRYNRDRAAVPEIAAELDELGYGTLWLPGGRGGEPPFEIVSSLLAATARTVVATGILSIWGPAPEAVALEQERLAAAHPDRFLLGLGVSHATFPGVDDAAVRTRPRAAMAAYLDRLDAALGSQAPGERVIAALGPRMLELARDRSRGAHPYLVTPEHTAAARAILGAGALLAPEQAVVFVADPERAREIAREHLTLYLELPNYTNNMQRWGFAAADFEAGGSDRLVDALVAWGDDDAIAARIAEHRAAGADHVAVQVLTGRRGEWPLAEWRRLAALA